MLSYDTQLEIKRDVVVKAYLNFSSLPPSAVPVALPTIGSPKQYHYRTKITPHFEAPPKKARADPPPATPKPDWLKIGFNEIGKKTVIDIEVSPLLPPDTVLLPRARNVPSPRQYSTKPSVRYEKTSSSKRNHHHPLQR